MVFDNKIENFRRKACLVVGGHMTQTFDTVMYSIINKDTVHFALTMVMHTT